MKMSPAATASQRKLTPRQKQVLKLSAGGLSQNQIAGLMGVRFYTVAEHLKQIYRKLGVHNRTAAVMLAMENGLMEASAEPRATNLQPGGGQNPDPPAADFCPGCGHRRELATTRGSFRRMMAKVRATNGLLP